jgi:hypothetical protein
MKNTLIGLMVLATVLPACDQQTPDTPEDRNLQRTWQYTTAEGDAKKDIGNGIRLEIALPPLNTTAPVPGLEDSLNAFAYKHPLTGEPLTANALKTAVDSLYEDAIRENPENDVEWFVTREVNTLGRYQNTLSMAFHESSFMGGAHPNSFTIYKIFDVETGRRLSLSHLFSNEELKRCKTIAEQKFRTNRGMSDTSTYAYNGYWFSGNRFELTDNAALTDSGVIFLYNPYDIGPYSMGAIELEITFADIKSKTPL